MTAIPVRHTKFASWFDPDAWMEKMSGPKWKAVLKEEESLVKSYTNKPEVKKRIHDYVEVYKKTKDMQILFNQSSITIDWQSNFFKSWWFLTSPEIRHSCRDVLECNNAVYSITDIGDGAEYFELQKWSSPHKQDYKISPVGPDVAVIDNTVYYLGVKNKLQYNKLWKLEDGTKTCIYTETSPEVNLSILRLDDGRVLLSKENSQIYTYYTIPGLKKTSKPADWTWRDFFIRKNHGQKILMKGSKKLLEIEAGNILVDPYAVHLGQLPCSVYVITPTGTSCYTLNESLKLERTVTSKLTSKRIRAISKDGTPVYGILTYEKLPRYLFAVGYGAYGMESQTGPVTTRWGPLINSGWAILYTFLRGGGDHNETWAHAGRIDGRHKTIEDFEALVRAAQHILSISPGQTAIYGRSAGGLLMGGCLANNPDGLLASAIYAEVPYVDELRTITNNQLPLTVLEHNEFGNPERLEDFISVGLLSPADSALEILSPSIFVLTRTAEFDSQVFAYEPVKWIRRLRKGGGLKLAIIESGQGHFTPPDKTFRQWATDCALLDYWMTR